jgi:hypothetical protein
MRCSLKVIHRRRTPGKTRRSRHERSHRWSHPPQISPPPARHAGDPICFRGLFSPDDRLTRQEMTSQSTHGPSSDRCRPDPAASSVGRPGSLHVTCAGRRSPRRRFAQPDRRRLGGQPPPHGAGLRARPPPRRAHARAARDVRERLQPGRPPVDARHPRPQLAGRCSTPCPPPAASSPSSACRSATRDVLYDVEVVAADGKLVGAGPQGEPRHRRRGVREPLVQRLDPRAGRGPSSARRQQAAHGEPAVRSRRGSAASRWRCAKTAGRASAPAHGYALAGAHILVNASASWFVLGKHRTSAASWSPR